MRVPGYNLPDANEKNIKHKSFAVAKKNQNCMRFQKVRIQSKVFFFSRESTTFPRIISVVKLIVKRFWNTAQILRIIKLLNT